jgi:adenylate cyclase
MNQELAQLTCEQTVLIAKLHENENRVAQFLDAMPVGVAVLDANGQPYYINQKAEEILGKGMVPDTSSEKLSEVYQMYQAGTNREYPVGKFAHSARVEGGNC